VATAAAAAAASSGGDGYDKDDATASTLTPKKTKTKTKKTTKEERATKDSEVEGDAATASGSIYGNPALYELAFGFRDFEAEVKFLNELSVKHGTGELNDLLELGAGPAW
jgi:hypothetical protein